MLDPAHIRFAILATDVAIFSLRDDKLLVRLMQVDRPPFFVGVPGLPGGLIKPEETAEQAAKRLIKEKAQLQTQHMYLEQLYTFSEVDRDPRGRVVAVAYSAYVPWEKLSTSEREESEELWWQEVESLGKKMAYDHHRILALALSRLRSRITYTTLISKLMPAQFTLTQLELGYETILGKDLDKRNFRKKFAKLDLLEETGERMSGERWRPAKLYQFKTKEVETIEVL